MAFRLSLPLLIAGLFAGPLSAQQPQPPRRVLSEPTARILRERMGGEPFALLAAWARAEHRKPSPDWLPKNGGLWDAAFCELLHSALWSDDKDTAYAAACLIGESQLDIANIDRWLAAVWPHIFAEHPKYNFDTLKHVMSSDDVARLLHEPECWFADIRTHFLQNLQHSLPESVARNWAHDLFLDKGAEAAINRAHFPAWREQVLNQHPIAALVEYLAAQPPTYLDFTDLGLVEDDRIRDLLRKVRATPGANVQWAIGELTLAGDYPAKRELDEMRIRHLYGWFDYASANVRTLGRSLDMVPWLIGEIETICCRRNGAAWALRQLTGFDASDQPERGLVTQHEYAARWWRDVGEHLRWSHLAQRFVVTEH